MAISSERSSSFPSPKADRGEFLLNRMGFFYQLGSLRLTLVGLGILLIAACGYLVLPQYANLVLVLSLLVLSFNLICAVVTRPIFLANPALLLFHLALLAIVLLIAFGRITYLKGRLELTVGETFNGELIEYDSGIFHKFDFNDVEFTNLGYSVDYSPGLQRGATVNKVAWKKGIESGELLIGDQHPLVLNGYRFYTSFNKGFAPVFRWQPAGKNNSVIGSVHLPSYPAREYEQAQKWSIPEEKLELWTLLQIDEELASPDKAFTLAPPDKHYIVVRAGSRRFELRVGDSVGLPEGTLHYEGLRMWMGYTVVYEPSKSWLLAAAVIAVLSLAWFFTDKYLTKPWLSD